MLVLAAPVTARAACTSGTPEAIVCGVLGVATLAVPDYALHIDRQGIDHGLAWDVALEGQTQRFVHRLVGAYEYLLSGDHHIGRLSYRTSPHRLRSPTIGVALDLGGFVSDIDYGPRAALVLEHQTRRWVMTNLCLSVAYERDLQAARDRAVMTVGMLFPFEIF